MKIIRLIILIITFFFFSISFVKAQSDDFIIRNFRSEIEINQDTSLMVTETILVDFFEPRHGIYRDIPVIYPNQTSTIKANLEFKSVTDDQGNNYQYKVENNRQVKSIRIGDPNKLVNGSQTYVIKYQVDDVIQEYEDHFELYWNITGHEWPVEIQNASAAVATKFANIDRIDCFTGSFGGNQRECSSDFNENSAEFNSSSSVYAGNDFTIVVGLDKNNQFVFPGPLETGVDWLIDNFGYLVGTTPPLLIFIIWYKRGRDKRYVNDNIYLTPTDKTEKIVSIFDRKFLPLVYHPIDDLTPSEVGTIIDEKVQISDLIAEILELARLDYLKIQKLKKKGIILSSDEYAFIKTTKTDLADKDARLNNYQKYLLKEIFRKANVLRSVKEADKLFKNSSELEQVYKQMAEYDYVLLSGLKNHFYEGLPGFKNKLYERMDKENIFHGNPEKVRMMWIGIYAFSWIFFGIVLFRIFALNENYFMLISSAFFGLIGFVFAYSMPSRTSKGYSLKRQAEGLKWYLQKGKWRHEFAEKNLFIEEILPFAVALGVVNQLTQDMKELGIRPPSYMNGVTLSSFTNDLNTFSRHTASSLTSSPSSSGSSSWSGGSGFSGGSSGGGFGGGGGGSW